MTRKQTGLLSGKKAVTRRGRSWRKGWIRINLCVEKLRMEFVTLHAIFKACIKVQ